MTNKEHLIKEVFKINNKELAMVLSNNKNKCEFCTNVKTENCKVDDCEHGIKQWLETEYKKNKRIYKIKRIDFKKMNFSEWQIPKKDRRYNNDK